MSKGEDKINQILIRSHIYFEREKSFKDLKGGKLRFDFYIKNLNNVETIIEFDGEQHMKFVPHFYSSQIEWHRAQEYDRRKNSYCLAKDIALYRIPFYDLDIINSISDLIQDKYRVKTRWHYDLQGERK